MAVSDTEKLMTAEELLTLPDDGMRHELVKGKLVTMTPTGARHSSTAARLIRSLVNHVAEHDLGEVFASEGGFVLATDPDTIRAPDVAFISRERIPEEGLPDGFWPGPPDLAAEVVSPNDTSEAVQAKVGEYLDAGTQLVWVVHPNARTVTEYKSLDEVRVLTEEDTLDGGEVVPGFSAPVRELFA